MASMGQGFSSMGYITTAEHAKDRSRNRVRLKLPVLSYNQLNIDISDIANLFIIDHRDFPKFYQKIPNEYLKDSIYLIVTDLPKNKIRMKVPKEIQNNIIFDYVDRSKNSKHDISVAIVIIKVRLMCHNKHIRVMSRTKLMWTSLFIDKEVFGFRDCSVVSVTKPRKFRNFYEGEFTIHPVEKSGEKTIIEMIQKIVVRFNIRMIHFIDRDNVKLTQSQITEMIKKRELPLIFRNPKKDFINKIIMLDKFFSIAIFLNKALKDQIMSNTVDISVCRNQNFNWLFCDIENCIEKNITMPQNFPKEIMGEFLEPLHKLFLGRDLKQLSLKNVNLKNVAKKILTFLHFQNRKKKTFILISLECYMLMRMGIGNDKRMVLFTEKVQVHLKESNWDMCINYVVDDRFSAESFNTFLEQHMPMTTNDLNNNKNTDIDLINTQEVNAVPQSISLKRKQIDRSINVKILPKKFLSICPLIFTVPIIDDCADVLMIDMMTLLELKIRQETDFSVVSKDKIFESTVFYLNRTKKGTRKITLKIDLY